MDTVEVATARNVCCHPGLRTLSVSLELRSETRLTVRVQSRCNRYDPQGRRSEFLLYCLSGRLSYESTFVRQIEVLDLQLKQVDEEENPEDISRGKKDLLQPKVLYNTNSTLKMKQVDEEEKSEIEFSKGGKSDSKDNLLQTKVSYKANLIIYQ